MIVDDASKFGLATPTREKRNFSAAGAVDALTIGWTVCAGSPDVIQTDAGTDCS